MLAPSLSCIVHWSTSAHSAQSAPPCHYRGLAECLRLRAVIICTAAASRIPPKTHRPANKKRSPAAAVHRAECALELKLL